MSAELLDGIWNASILGVSHSGQIEVDSYQ